MIAFINVTYWQSVSSLVLCLVYNVRQRLGLADLTKIEILMSVVRGGSCGVLILIWMTVEQ